MSFDFDNMMNEKINSSVSRAIDERLTDFLSKIDKKIDSKLSMITYSIRQASIKTRIGYKKLYNASRKGILPSFQDGRVTRVREIDLINWIENEKRKNRL